MGTGGNGFYEIAAILALASLLGILGYKLRQPLLIAFLATGILAGPSCLGIIHGYDQIELLAHIGVALLLFIVGLRLDLNLIRTIGPVALATGLGQIIFTFVIGFGIAAAMGMPLMSAAYVSIALTFSSTIIIVKLLSDKKEIDSLHGRIAVGFLIVQDIAAIAALVGLTILQPGLFADESGWKTAIIIAAKGLGLFMGVGLAMRYAIPRLLRRLAHSQEMLVLFAVAWAVFLGAMSELLGFSKEIGAFLAGVSLASNEYRDLTASRLTGLRDFLLLFFFIDLGARLDWSAVGAQLGASAVFSLFVLIGNPLIVMIIMGFMGYRRRTGFLAGLTVAQISEFSLILAAMGVSIGHITKETMGLITLVGVVTILLSTYMILYSGPLYRLLSNVLKIFEKKNPYREAAETAVSDTASVDVVLFGLGNYGSKLAEHLLARQKSIMGVDFDPNALERFRGLGVSIFYGDIGDPDIYEQLPLNRARWVVSSIRSRESSHKLLSFLKYRGYDGKVALAAANEEEAKVYTAAGAHVVFRPFSDAAEQAADALTEAIDMLPENVNWPIAFREIRIRPGSAFAGRTIRGIPLRSTTGASVLAVVRTGRIHYEPGPDFQIYPGDRLVIMGHPDELKDAEDLLGEMQKPESGEEIKFAMAEIEMSADSKCAGQTLEQMRFRQEYGVTVVGICRAGERIMFSGPHQTLKPEDRLIVIGASTAVDSLKKSEPL